MARTRTERDIQKQLEAAVALLKARIAELEAENARLRAEIAGLRAEIARLKKDSSTSSKPPSTGQIAKIIQKASAALGPSHAELEGALPWQSVMNIDETGHPEKGKKLWTWGFHVPGSRGFTWFHIDPSRSEAQNMRERFRDHGAY